MRNCRDKITVWEGVSKFVFPGEFKISQELDISRHQVSKQKA